MRLPEGSPHQDDNTRYYLLIVTVKDAVTLQELYFQVWKRRWNPNTGWDKGIRIPTWCFATPETEGETK